jgi:deoxycytidylate deaminase
MYYASKQEEQEAQYWMQEAGKVAQSALCLKAKCGSVIVRDGVIIGKGFNAPPLNSTQHQKCHAPYDNSGKPKYDHTCCMHAEWRAIIDALKNNPSALVGSTLYFTRVDDKHLLIKSGLPFCTACSRFALDTGIAHFVLWNDKGIAVYDTTEYNSLSYDYRHSAE